MKIGFATPVSLRLLKDYVRDGEDLPEGYVFGPSANWIVQLLERGHEVTVYTTDKSIEATRSYYGPGLTIRIAKARPRGQGKDFFAYEIEQLSALMRLDSCEVLHAHWTYEFALAALSTGKPTLTTIHDLPWRVLWYFRDAHRAARLIMAYQVALQGNTFSAVSEDAARHFRHFFKPNADIYVVPNYLDDSVFALGQEPLPASDRPFTYATILQGWTRRKNANTALTAFREVRKTYPHARLVMIGADYGVHGKAQEWAVAQGMADGVVFKGQMPYESMLAFVREEVDVLVHPSLDESFSMTALECMALQKPVIAGINTPGVRWVLDYGRVGLLVDVRKPMPLAEAMTKLAADPELRASLSKVAYAHAWDRFRAAAVVPQYEAIYRRLLKEG